MIKNLKFEIITTNLRLVTPLCSARWLMMIRREIEVGFVCSEPVR